MVVETHLGPNTEVHQHIPKGHGGNIGVGGVITYQLTLMSQDL